MPIDHHTHFTGGLPMDFVEHWSRSLERDQELAFELARLLPPGRPRPAGLRCILTAIRRVARQLEPSWFYAAYAAIQRATRPGPEGPESASYRYYSTGFEAILRSRAREGLDGLSLFVSVGRSLDVLDLKLRAMRDASAQVPALRVAVRLTLPRTSSLQLPQASEVVTGLLRRLAARTSDYRLVEGIDISGDESSTAWKSGRQVLRELVDFRAVGSRPVSISLHLGENLVTSSAPELLDQFDDVLALKVDSIGHGVFAWIPERRLVEDARSAHLAGFARERAGLMERIRSLGTVIEVCPMTMLLTQRAVRQADLPTRLPPEQRPRIAIGTDSPALFATSLHKELRYAGYASASSGTVVGAQ